MDDEIKKDNHETIASPIQNDDGKDGKKRKVSDIVTTPSSGIRLNRRRKGKKRKLSSSDEEQEELRTIEEKLQEVAKKNNLSSFEVKKILRKLVGNEHVLALVKIQEDEENRLEQQGRPDDGKSDDLYELTLTRSKARTLKWKPIQLPALSEPEPEPEVAALISQDLHSDEDDEEYHPQEDDLVSDDDPSTTISDVDSQPRTPMSNPPTPQAPNTVGYSQDGIFKVPRNLNAAFDAQMVQQEEIIAKRTRSKLCLQTTPIEAIESNFVPPDITTDMYDLDQDIDIAWKEFLHEFTKPLNNAIAAEEDDEADPEYIAADKVPMDAEELRDVNISKKELNDLLNELINGLTSSGTLRDDDELLETPKKTSERSGGKSPLRKKQKMNDVPEATMEIHQFEESSPPVAEITIPNASEFNPNIMSTPEVAMGLQNVDQGSEMKAGSQFVQINYDQSYNPAVALPVPLPHQEQSTVYPVPAPSATSSAVFPIPGQVYTSSSVPLQIDTTSLQTVIGNNKMPLLIAFQFPGTSGPVQAIPLNFTFPTVAGPTPLAVSVEPSVTNTETPMIDLTNSQSIDENYCTTSTEIESQPLISRKRPKISESLRAPYEDLDICSYEKWRNDRPISIKKYMRREYTEKFEALKTIENPVIDDKQNGFLDHQVKILQQQMQMHVQFAAQNFFQTYGHPEFWKLANGSKEILLELEKGAEGKQNSAFNAWNLKAAVDLVKNWEVELSKDNQENKDQIKFLYNEIEKAKCCNIKTTPTMKFPPRTMQNIVRSPVFMYPDLLPKIPFRVNVNIAYHEFSPSEDHLIALGMERYFKELDEEKRNRKFRNSNSKLRIVAERISRNLTIGKNPCRIFYRMKSLRNMQDDNPIKFYMNRKIAPPFNHSLRDVDYSNVLPPEKRIPDLPFAWKEYVLSLKAANIKKSEILGKDFQISNELSAEEPVRRRTSKRKIQSVVNKSVTKSLDNSIKSSNVVINFNYVFTDSDKFTNPISGSLNFTGICKAAQNLSAESILQKLGEDSTISELSEPVTSSQQDQIPGNFVNYSQTDGGEYSEETPCQILGANNSGNKSGDSCTSDTLVVESSGHQTRENLSDSVLKGQKLLTDYFEISNEKSITKAGKSRIRQNFRQKLRRRLRRLRCRRIHTRKYLKHIKKIRLRNYLKLKLCFLVTFHHRYLDLLCQNYCHENLRCIFRQFKILELYTDLLRGLKMSCRKAKAGTSSEDGTSSKKSKSGSENASNARVRKAIRANEYLRRMITPERQEDIVKKDAVYALNFYDKVEETLSKSGNANDFKKFQNILKSFNPNKDKVPDLYNKVEKLFLPKHPELAEMLLTFLLPGEAAQVGKFFEHFMVTNMGVFLNKLNLYFSRQPAQIKKIYAGLNELAEDKHLTVEKIKDKILPLLKGNQFLMDWFIQIFPMERPPESITSVSETVNFKTMDKQTKGTECENLPVDALIEDGPADQRGCQIKYLNGRIFYGSKILLPAKLVFLADELIKRNVSGNAQRDGSPLRDSSSGCLHGMKDLAEKLLKQATDTCDEAEKSEDDENGESSKKYTICDNAAFKAHAIRLNPSLYTSNKENHQHRKVVSPKKPVKMNVPATVQAASKEKRKSPKKNLPRSPVGAKRCASAQLNSGAELSSKAIGTAKKLKSMVEGNLPEDQNKPKKQKSQEKSKQKSEITEEMNGKNHTTDDNNASDVCSLKPQTVAGEEDVESNIVPWTREEDKIILEEVKLGFKKGDVLIEKLAENLPHRTENEIVKRHQFLMDVLSKLQSRG